ncbi:MAG: DNA polymerase III subunit beta [Parcubacteria group bacterium SW_4_46_8]|nr:MAG: DNA polymerase III subunit beta [Parcubacteria group bacterium SW_4_46_8]
MHITCIQEKIEDAVTKAAPITGKDLSLPVLECVLLEVKENNLVVKSTDLEIGVAITVPVKVKETGTVAVPADVLRNFLSTLPDSQKVILETDGNTLQVTTTHSETHMKTQPHDEFPSIPEVEEGEAVELPAEKVINGFESVYYSASASSMKPELSSVNMFAENGELVFVATDSFRLAEKRIPTDEISDLEEVLLPYTNVAEVTQIFDDSTDAIELVIGDNQVAFASDNVYVTSRVIDGVFPDYKQIIPDTQDTEVTTLKQDLLNTLKLANIFADKFNQVTISVDTQQKECMIQTNNEDVGENKGTVDATIEGEDITAHFNYQYIIDCFQSISTDSVSMQFSEEKPMTIEGVGDDSFLYLVMPMNK